MEIQNRYRSTTSWARHPCLSLVHLTQIDDLLNYSSYAFPHRPQTTLCRPCDFFNLGFFEPHFWHGLSPSSPFPLIFTFAGQI